MITNANWRIWVLALGICCLSAGAEVVTVRYYNMAGIAEKALQDAIQTARQSFASARIPVRWLHCTHGGSGCTGHSGTPSRMFELRVTSETQNAEFGTTTMGVALLVPAGGSTHAKVSMSRVARFAKRVDLPVSRVLGYAIAHEVGHLLMERGQHSNFGIMRGHWAVEERGLISGGRFQFDGQDVRRMRIRTGVR